MNEQQESAAKSPNGYVQIVAGPGTGKTFTMVHRVNELIKRGIPPEKIVVMSFTKLAAKEIRTRLEKELKTSDLGVRCPSLINTFHSIALTLLTRSKAVSRLRLIDERDSLDVLKLLDPEMPLADLKSIFVEDAKLPAHLKKLKGKFLDYCKTNNLCSYDELLILFRDFLRTEMGSQITNDIKAVIIDEFQDTCKVQLEIALLMSKTNHNLTVVGDPHQSIYSWRGAEPLNFKLMRDAAPLEVLQYFLTKNYRSAQPILDLAYRVLKSDFQELKKQESHHNQKSTPVQLVRWNFNDGALEAYRVADHVDSLLKHGVEPKDICILARRALSLASFAAAFKAKSIPVKMRGGIFQLRGSKVDVYIDYLRACLYPEDSVAFRKTINNPVRGIGPKSLEKLGSEHGELSVSAARNTDQKGYQEYITALDTIKDLMSSNSQTKSYSSLQVKAAFEYLQRTFFPTHNIEPLINAVDAFQQEYIQTRDETEQSFAHFLADCWALDAELDSEPEKTPGSKVTCSTIHSAKGLEWPSVILLGCDRDRSENEMEELRLLYVALTRAKRHLVITLNKDENTKRLRLPPSMLLSKLPSSIAPVNSALIDSLSECGCSNLKRELKGAKAVTNFSEPVLRFASELPPNYGDDIDDDIENRNYLSSVSSFDKKRRCDPQLSKVQMPKNEPKKKAVKKNNSKTPSITNFFSPKSI